MTRQMEEASECTVLRERRERARINIGEDQKIIDRLNAQLRQAEIQIADKRAELRRMDDGISVSVPGPQSRDDRDRSNNNRGPWDDLAGALGGPIARRLRRRELEREIRELESKLARIHGDLQPRLRLWNETIADHHQIRSEMRKLGCFNP